jgi:hypothetical protein
MDSILSKGLLVSKGQKGMASEVYGSLDKSDAFYHAAGAAVRAAQRLIQQEGQPRDQVVKNLKVAVITANKARFPYKVYEGSKFLRSKVDVPPEAFSRIEYFKHLDVEKYNRKVSDARAEGKNISTIPLPKPIKAKSRKAEAEEVFLAFVFAVDDGAE